MKLELDARQVLDAADAAGQIVNSWQALARLGPVLTQLSQLMGAVPALEEQVSQLQGQKIYAANQLADLRAQVEEAKKELTALEHRLEREAAQASERIAATVQAARDQAKLIIQEAEHAARAIEEEGASRRTAISHELDDLAAKRDEAQAKLGAINLQIMETLAKLANVTGVKADESAS